MCGFVTRLHLYGITNIHTKLVTQITKFMRTTWDPPGSCRPQMSPMLAPWALLSGISGKCYFCVYECIISSILVYLVSAYFTLMMVTTNPDVNPDPTYFPYLCSFRPSQLGSSRSVLLSSDASTMKTPWIRIGMKGVRTYSNHTEQWLSHEGVAI